MIRYCTQCGHPASQKVPDGDHKIRSVCSSCHHIHYENPKIVVGCIAEWQNQILLCKRAIQPRAEYWTLPAGFMENEESTLEAALRETREEAMAQVQPQGFFALVNIPHISQVHLFYRGILVDGLHHPGEESLETALYKEADIPWNSLAFRSVHYCLEHYFTDRRRGVFDLHQVTLHPV